MCCKCRDFIEQNQKVSVGIVILQPDTPENEAFRSRLDAL